MVSLVQMVNFSKELREKLFNTRHHSVERRSVASQQSTLLDQLTVRTKRIKEFASYIDTFIAVC